MIWIFTSFGSSDNKILDKLQKYVQKEAATNKNKKHEVNDVTSDVGKEELVTMKYIEELNKFYKKDEGVRVPVITQSHNLIFILAGELSFLTGL